MSEKMSSFSEDVKKGTIAENIFAEDFLEYFNIPYKNVSKEYLGYDFTTSIGTIEIMTVGSWLLKR